MTRVFTVEVTGCRDCPYSYKPLEFCRAASLLERGLAYQQNQNAITESCPMFNKSFVKDEKK